METGGRRKIQIIFLVIFILLLIRVGLIWKERHDAGQVKQAPTAQPLSSDAYVVPPKLHAFDLASARQGLEGKTIWVMAGSQLQYFATHADAVAWKQPVGTLPVMDELHVRKVEQVSGPVEIVKQGDLVFHKSQRKVIAVFTRGSDPTQYAVNIGSIADGSYSFIVDDAFFLEDPHTLYKHWPSDVWKAIGEHQATKGMNELQTSLALGPGRVISGSEYGERTMQYESNGKTVTVTFSHNHATDIQGS